MIQIIPGILATSEEQYQKDLNRLSQVTALENSWVHIDFMDNIFVPNLGIEPAVTAKYSTMFKKIAHLMVKNPVESIDKLKKADFKRVLVHIESNNAEECIDKAKDAGLEVGLVLNPKTPVEKTKPFLSKLDTILLMSVVPGFQGQPFEENVFDKIKEAINLREEDNYSFTIGVDGAVKDTNIKDLLNAGIDYVIVGSFLLKGDIEENLERLWEATQ